MYLYFNNVSMASYLRSYKIKFKEYLSENYTTERKTFYKISKQKGLK